MKRVTAVLPGSFRKIITKTPESKCYRVIKPIPFQYANVMKLKGKGEELAALAEATICIFKVSGFF